MRVEFSPWVEGDLEAIADYIAQDNPARAVSFIREIRTKIRAVGRRPQLYRLRPEIGDGARIAVTGRYILLFRIVGEIVRIERVVFGGCNLPELLEE
jgi:toxin ParE1/3/4